MNKILVLGAGMVSRPGVHYLLQQPGFQVSVGEKIFERAQKLVEGYPNGRAIPLDVENTEELRRLVGDHEIVISLLPWTLHMQVAQTCLEFGKNMVTTSYVSEGMRALAPEVEQKGLVFLNEIGVDPGLDHMSAMRIIDRAHLDGGKVLHFHSICGGLPAPDDNNNPFGYKFSWSPRGVLLASRNSARFLEEGQIIEIPGQDLFLHFRKETIEGIGELEIYPNRDSLAYREIYNIPEIRSLFRGTYRYPGWCRTLKAVVDLHLIDDTPLPPLKKRTFRSLLADRLGADPEGDLKDLACQKTGLPPRSDEMKRLEWLGLFSDEPLPDAATPLDILCLRMQEKLFYREGEKDMLVMRHTFRVQYPDRKQRIITSTLIDYGIPHGDSAMSRTVSLPMAIATCMIVTGRVQLKGVCIPTQASIYEPVLHELEKLGIRMEEQSHDAG